MLLSLALIIGLALWIVVPYIISEAGKTMDMIRDLDRSGGVIPFVPESWQIRIQELLNADSIMQLVSIDNIQSTLKEIAPKVWSLLTGTFSVVISVTVIFIVFLYFIFILLDYEKIAGGWIQLVPKQHRSFVEELSSDVEVSMNRYFRGQSMVALCVGILFAIGFTIIGLPMGIALGLFMGALNLVPYLQTLGILPMALLALLKSVETGENFWIIIGLSVLVLIVVQVIQDMLLTPKIMGKAMGLNPAVILLSLSIWCTLLGFVGLIIALPLTTLCLSYYKRFVIDYQEPASAQEATGKSGGQLHNK
jgi:predicted PurR-regulated permease PerM